MAVYRVAQINLTPEIEVFNTVPIGYCDYHPVTKSAQIGCCDYFSNVPNVRLVL